MRGCHSPGAGRITAPGSSWPQSIRIVQRKRRPTSKVDSMMVLRAEARRHRFEIRDFAGRAAAGHSVPPRWSDVCVVSFIWEKTARPARLLRAKTGSPGSPLRRRLNVSVSPIRPSSAAAPAVLRPQARSRPARGRSTSPSRARRGRRRRRRSRGASDGLSSRWSMRRPGVARIGVAEIVPERVDALVRMQLRAARRSSPVRAGARYASRTSGRNSASSTQRSGL